ncbi:MAG: ACP S-malonyltransferase [Bacteroidota bacterium]
MTAFLFPGQGAQHAGMGRDLYDAFPAARARFEEANELLGFDLTALMLSDDAEALRQTDITQPALYLHSLVVMALLEARGEAPAMVAGHSLGEYSALAAAGALTFADGLRIVRLRGQLMAGAGQERPGTMAAVLGLDDEALEAVCAEATTGADSLVQPANYNAPGQIVISGDVDAVARAVDIAPSHGARRVVPLSVSGAFHSPLMAEARDGLAEGLQSLRIQPPRCPVYLNVSAQPTTDPDTIRQGLLDQLTAPVRWAQTLRQMHADGATRFAEVGAGKVLSGLVRRTLGREVEAVPYGTASALGADVAM